MLDNVLVAFDGPPLSERALTSALDHVPDATITTLYGINPTDSVIDGETGDLPVAEVGKPTREILDYADGTVTGQTGMGSRGRPGLHRTALGSGAGTVTRRTRSPVTIVG